MCSTERPLTPVNHYKVQYRSEDMNNSVKEDSATEPPTPVVHPEQASVSKLCTIGRNSSNQMLNEDDVKGQVTPMRSGEVIGSKRRKKRNTVADATVVNSPDWLPKGWTTEMKCRETGSTAGTRDKYYIDPVSGHRFRSKPDVLRYLQTGEITKKQKSKLRGNGNSESQRFPLPSADASNLQVPDINSSSGMSGNLKIDINLVSVPTHAQKDADESTRLQNREPHTPVTNGKVEAMQPLEITKAAVQDLLPEENNKRKTLSTECKMDMKSQRFPLPSADASNVQVPGINSSSGVPGNLKIDINLVSVPTHAQKDADESTRLQNREPYTPVTNGFKVEAMQPLEITKAAVQDLLPEENNKRKTLNTECKMDMKSQRFPLPSADASNLQVPDINSSSGVPGNLKIDINLVSVPTHAQKDADESTRLQNREPYAPVTNGFKVEAMQPLEITNAAVQDLLPEENNKRKTLSTERKMDMKRKRHLILVLKFKDRGTSMPFTLLGGAFTFAPSNANSSPGLHGNGKKFDLYFKTKMFLPPK